MTRSKNIIGDFGGCCDAFDWEGVLESYLCYLQGCGRANSTIDMYRDHVSRFYRMKKPLWDNEKLSFMEWNGEPQINTNHRLDCCRRFWDWGISEGWRKTNPAANVKKRLLNKAVKANVSLDEIGKILTVFKDEYREKPFRWERLRNYAYFLFSIGTGIRPGEGLHIRRCDINLSERSAVIQANYVKTRQSRVIYMPSSVVLDRLLKKMVKLQEKAGLPSQTPLFSDSSGKAITTRSWYHIVNKRARPKGIRIRPYDLRHSFITHSLINGANPYDLRDQVGHSNMDMMKRYFHSNAEARRKTANLAPLASLGTI